MSVDKKDTTVPTRKAGALSMTNKSCDRQSSYVVAPKIVGIERMKTRSQPYGINRLTAVQEPRKLKNDAYAVVVPTIPTLSSTPNATTASTLATTPTEAPTLAPTSTATETQTNNAPKPQATQAEPKTTPTETPKPAAQASTTTNTFKHFEIPPYLRNF